MWVDNAISLKTRIIKFSKKRIRKFNVLRQKTNSCDRKNFKSVQENKALYANLRQLCSGVYCWDNFLTADECNTIIQISKNDLKRSIVAGEDKLRISSHRTSHGTLISDQSISDIAEKIRTSISKLSQLPIANQEEIKVIRYEVGQEYKIHHDCHLPKGGKDSVFLKQGGFRIFSCLLYLNDKFEGGNTTFPELNLSCKPKAGTLLIWNNLDGRDIKSEMIHRAEPIIEGEKWAVTTWVREYEYGRSA